MRTQDLVALFGTLEAVGNEFRPPISKSAVCQWGDDIPELRVYQLREKYPDIDEQIAALKSSRLSRRNGKKSQATA